MAECSRSLKYVFKKPTSGAKHGRALLTHELPANTDLDVANHIAEEILRVNEAVRRGQSWLQTCNKELPAKFSTPTAGPSSIQPPFPDGFSQIFCKLRKFPPNLFGDRDSPKLGWSDFFLNFSPFPFLIYVASKHPSFASRVWIFSAPSPFHGFLSSGNVSVSFSTVIDDNHCFGHIV